VSTLRHSGFVDSIFIEQVFLHPSQQDGHGSQQFSNNGPIVDVILFKIIYKLLSSGTTIHLNI
jgi:hypothetical protein